MTRCPHDPATDPDKPTGFTYHCPDCYCPVIAGQRHSPHETDCEYDDQHEEQPPHPPTQ